MVESEKDSKYPDLGQVRGFVESIYVAIVLAFVLRAFLIEAFVIPTGSMATTLYGAHCRLQCDCCGMKYEVGTSSEPRFAAECPNCGYRSEITASSMFAGGDRVLVLKYLYKFLEPKPWDVVVFRNPKNNRENYIKRLIGLPGESIQIINGDIFVGTDPDHPKWKIRRKPAYAQESLWILLHDNDYTPNAEMLRSYNIQQATWEPVSEVSGWNAGADRGRVLKYKGHGRGSLRFRGRRGLFCASNSYNSAVGDTTEDTCTDLRLELMFRPLDERHCRLSLEFIDFDKSYMAVIDKAGSIQLQYEGHKDEVKVPPFEAGSGHLISFCKVDYKLRIYLDGKIILESDDGKFGNIYNLACEKSDKIENMDIPIPVGVEIEAEGEGTFELRHIKLYRDVYYTASGHSAREGSYAYMIEELDKEHLPRNWRRPDGPGGWGVYPHPIHLRRDPENPELDEFFCLGDNSPSSEDGRCWLAAAATLRLFDENKKPVYQMGTVPRYNMIGRAIWVYWPSGFTIPVPGKARNLPFFKKWSILPNVGRMRLIR